MVDGDLSPRSEDSNVSENSLSLRPETSLAPVAAPTTEKSYLARCWEHTFEEWRRHPKLELSAGVIAAISGGICGIFFTGVTWAAIGGVTVGAIAGFLIGLLFIFLYYLLLSPKGVDEKGQTELVTARLEIDKVRDELTSQLDKLKADIEKSQKHKLIFEVDKRNTRVRVEQTKSALRIWLSIQLRFENRDVHPLSVKQIDISLHRSGIKDVRSGAEIFTRFGILRITSGGVQIDKAKLEGMTLAGHALSPFYLPETLVAIEDEHVTTADELDVTDYLRITMQSSGYQPEFAAKLHPYWKAALEHEGTSQISIIGAPSIDKDYRRLD